MYVQLSHYQIKPGHRSACIELMNRLKPQIMALPGLKQFLNVINDDDSGYVLAVMASQEQAQKNEGRVRELWTAFAAHLTQLPAVEGHEILADWHA